MELPKVDVQLEHSDEDRSSPDKIVLKLQGGDSNTKTWVTLTGYHISSFKAASELNRYDASSLSAHRCEGP